MVAFGQRLADLLRAGDLLLLDGPVGAGKTTLTRGIGAGLGVRGPITSPTFVIARLHPSLVGGPPLLHVDAYRLGGVDELADLDLEMDTERAVTVAEWGLGIGEVLAESHLTVRIQRGVGESGGLGGSLAREGEADVRLLEMRGFGARWQGEDFATLAG
jgi:tRNA threonylcarbamoyladenosine biosynthesis protein TsaE